MPAPETRGMADRPFEVGARRSQRLVHRLAERQERRDRRGERAPGPVRVPGVDARVPSGRTPRPAVQTTSTTRSPIARWPPFTTTTRGPSARIRRAAARMSSSVRMDDPARTSASGTFGVTTSASFRSSVLTAATASSRSSRSPPLAIITGSTTRFGRSSAWIVAATASTIAAVASMPVLTAAGGRSPPIASICAMTSSVDTASQAVTPRVFWAVTAVTAQVPYTPHAANVFRSAWMPAPPPESLPAIVSAVGIQ